MNKKSIIDQVESLMHSSRMKQRLDDAQILIKG